MNKVDITAVVNAYREGLLAYPTLLSLSQAVAEATRQGINVEVLLVLDCSDHTTNEVFKAYCRKHNGARILAVDCDDLGQSRNAAVRAACGEWIAFLDADDLFAANWLSAAHDVAIRDSRMVIWHPAISLYFGASTSIYEYIDCEDRDYKVPGLALENYWHALIFTRRSLLLEIPYPSTDLQNQIGYEDWSWNLRVIANGGLHKVVPDTGHAIRVKEVSLVKRTTGSGCLPLQVPLFRNIIEERRIFCSSPTSVSLEDPPVQRDAPISSDTIHANAAEIEAQLTTAPVRNDEAEVNLALPSNQSVGGVHRLMRWVLRKRVLLTLLRRSPEARVASVYTEAAELGVAELITDPFVHWLCKRRTLLGLLRCSVKRGKEIVLRAHEASCVLQDAAVLHVKRLLTQLRVDDTARKVTLSVTSLTRYYQCLGFDQAVAQVWANLLTSGGLGFATSDALGTIEMSLRNNVYLDRLTKQVLGSDLFDEAFYRSNAAIDSLGTDAAAHYLLLGEPLGLMPSLTFDPEYYGRRNPDVATSGMNCLVHYDLSGRLEGRKLLSPNRFHSSPGKLDPSRENVILVVHETSRTGAPILGWNIAQRLVQTYNVFTIRIGDGDLTPEFEALCVEVHGPFIGTDRHPVDVEFSLRSLFADRVFKYAIINSIESRQLIEVCARQFVPTLLLMHEFGSYIRPLESLQRAFDCATEIVFPARTVAQSSLEAHPALLDRRVHIEPQGMSIVPKSKSIQKPPNHAQMNFLSQARAEGNFIVMGGGSIGIRKGVDLFISVAACAQRLELGRSVNFLWVGGGYFPDEDMGYSIYLKEQIERSGLKGCVTFMDEVSDLEPVYELAHVFLLTSRLDPLPNVSIDAALRGIPIICFKDASGTAELMLANHDTAIGVVAHLDTNAAANVIASLATDERVRMRMANATRRLAQTLFDMSGYVERLDVMGSANSMRGTQQRADAETLGTDESFDRELFLGLGNDSIRRDQAIARYLGMAAFHRFKGPDALSFSLRRPMAGFNPWLWAAAYAKPGSEGPDPLADFIRRGQPPGPWKLPVLRPALRPVSLSPHGLRALLHVHLADPDLSKDLQEHLRANTALCDLLITTDNEDKAAQLRNSLSVYRQGTVAVAAVLSGGSAGLQPLLTSGLLQSASYDVVGHIHDDPESRESDRRDFFWQNLLGGRHAMQDLTLSAFAKQPKLGLVFPSDPALTGWGKTRPYVEKFMAQLDHNQTLPDALDFPSAGMFWARTVVLNVLMSLVSGELEGGRDHSPADEDIRQGALARVIPLVSQIAGLSQVVTYVPGIIL